MSKVDRVLAGRTIARIKPRPLCILCVGDLVLRSWSTRWLIPRFNGATPGFLQWLAGEDPRCAEQDEARCA